MDFKTAAANMKKSIVRNLNELGKMPVEELLAQRIKKFQDMGVYKG
jgi:acetyl-CoA carboxylase alpha subunit